MAAKPTEPEPKRKLPTTGRSLIRWSWGSLVAGQTRSEVGSRLKEARVAAPRGRNRGVLLGSNGVGNRISRTHVGDRLDDGASR